LRVLHGSRGDSILPRKRKGKGKTTQAVKATPHIK